MKVKVFTTYANRLESVITEWLKKEGPETIDIISVTQSGNFDGVTVTIFYKKSYSERD